MMTMQKMVSIKEWSKSDYENNSQKNYLSKDGNLYIVISENKDIEDFFDKKEIDDCETMDFHFKMLDVGNIYSDKERYIKSARVEGE